MVNYSHMEELTSLGFNERESDIYLLLLSLGMTTASVVSKELSLDRRVVYDTLDMMAKKGFVIKSKVNNILHYESTNPEELKEKFYESFKNYEKILPKLNQLKQKQSKSEYKVWFGIPAINRMVNNALKSKSEVFLMGRGGYLIEQMKESRYQYIQKLNQLNWKMIQTLDYKKTLHEKEFIPKEIKFLPENINLDTAFLVFDDKLYLFTRKQQIEVIEIIGKSFAETFKVYFNLMWQIAKK